MTRNKFSLGGFILLYLIVVAVGYAGRPEGSKPKTRLGKTATNDFYSTILINNVTNYYSNNGDASFNPYVNDGAFEFPKGSGGIAIFEDGPVWGGYQSGVKKVGGSTYNHGLQAGRIITAGDSATATLPVADNPGLLTNRIFRVRPDVSPATPFADVEQKLLDEEVPYIARYEGSSITAQSIYNQYIADWNEWPAAYGAPYKDVNTNGTYEPGTDIPGVVGADQTLWHVSNDLDNTRSNDLYGSNPVGIELQRTIWAYRRTGALGNALFVSYKMINKSGFGYDSVYFSQWSDPDLGGALGFTDDFTGCDTSRSLGFVYNGDSRDGFYGDKPPAVGFDFFQGPIVRTGSNSDSAVFLGKYRKQYKNLKMSAFNFFINGNATYADPRLEDPRGTDEWYNLMNGLVGRTGAQYIDPTTGTATKFVLRGDPVTGTGWRDGSIAPPGDRRLALITGPFRMANADTQEVVVAVLCGQGSDRLSSISVLRFYSDQAQAAYDLLFDLPTPPPAPVVDVSNLDGELVLNWGGVTSSAATENSVSKGYTFQGYNVYQFPGNSSSGGKLLATYDKVDGIGKINDDTFDEVTGSVLNKPVQFGNDNGVSRYYRTTDDAISSKKLVNGRSYYYGVTAYSYNPTGVPRSLESQVIPYTAIPQGPKPGEILNSTSGQILSAGATSLLGGTIPTDGSVIARVIDPKKATGHLYKIAFATVGPNKVWSVIDSTTGQTKASNVALYGDVGDAPIVDGIQYAILDPGASGGFKEARLIRDGATDLSASPPLIHHRFNPGGTWAFDIIGATSSATALARMGTSLEGSNDYEIRATAGGSQYYAASFQVSAGDPRAANRLPLEFWDITNNRRLIPGVRDADGDGLFTTDIAEGPGPVAGISTLTGGVWDAIYVQDPTSAGAYTEPLPDPAASNSAGFAFRRVMFMNADTSRTAPFPVPVGTVIRLITNKPIRTTHSFVVNTSSVAFVANNAAAAKSAVENVNVYPNPYFGFNTDEPSKYVRFVTFSHLPQKATIRIFSLSGVLVRTIAKDDPSQYARWDLQNGSGLPVASGVYVAHVDMPTVGSSKVLKLSVIQETQILDKY